MDKLDIIIRNIITKKPGAKEAELCVDEQIIAAFVEGTISETESAGIQNHILDCPGCLERVKILQQLKVEQEQAQQARVPASLYRRVIALDPSGRSPSNRFVDVVVGFTRNMVDIIKGEGLTVPQMALAEALRSGQQALSETLVTFTKRFPPYQAEVEVEKVRQDRGEITIKLHKMDSPEIPVGLRVSLFDDKRELESSLIEDGQVTFQNIKFGKYRLNITETGKEIGRISLTMKGEGKHE